MAGGFFLGFCRLLSAIAYFGIRQFISLAAFAPLSPILSLRSLREFVQHNLIIWLLSASYCKDLQHSFFYLSSSFYSSRLPASLMEFIRRLMSSFARVVHYKRKKKIKFVFNIFAFSILLRLAFLFRLSFIHAKASVEQFFSCSLRIPRAKCFGEIALHSSVRRF